MISGDMPESAVKCRKCLLAELDEDEYIRSLKEYIKEYPPEKKAPEDIYKKRIEICRECPSLSGGMCRKCGCYAEIRALDRRQKCPDVPARW